MCALGVLGLLCEAPAGLGPKRKKIVAEQSALLRLTVCNARFPKHPHGSSSWTMQPHTTGLVEGRSGGKKKGKEKEEHKKTKKNKRKTKVNKEKQ